MLTPRSAARRYGQWSLIGTVVAIAIILVLAAVYFPKIAARHHQLGQAATPIERGYGVACISYQSQMTQAAEMYKSAHDGTAPTSLDQLKSYGVTDDMIHAPGCAFQLGPGGVVTDVGHGQALPGVPTSPGVAPANGGQRGPGGITIPAIPGSGAQAPGGDVGE